MENLNLNWQVGDPIESPVHEMVHLDPRVIGPQQTYKLMIGLIVPRPIAFVSTISSEGIRNLAPFSFFNGVSSNPPALVISVTRNSDGSKKDTLRNIESTGEFVVNSVNEWLLGPMNQCSGQYPYGVDEMQKVGLTPLPSETVKPFRVKESAAHFECKVYKTLEVGDGTEGSSTLIVGVIERIHIHSLAYRDGKIVLEEFKPLSRMAGNAYARVEGVFNLPRPSVDKK